MRRIKLTQNKYALVDDEDFKLINKYSWYFHNLGYARSMDRKTKKQVYMHRLILKVENGKFIDHINMNKLDNRKSNLRFADHSQNKWNRDKLITNTSGFKGVSWNKNAKKWVANIWKDNKCINLGYFPDKIDAAFAYNDRAKKLFGNFAKLNEI